MQSNVVNKLDIRNDMANIDDKKSSPFLLFQIPDDQHTTTSVADPTSALALQNITYAPGINQQLELNPWTSLPTTISKGTLNYSTSGPVAHQNVIVQNQNSLKRSHQQVQVATQTLQEETPYRTEHLNFLDISTEHSCNNKNNIENFQSDDKKIIRQISETTAEDLTQSIPNQKVPADTIVDVDSETDSNHDTALTLACSGGHEELVELLVNRGANIEHRDKKGFTPLILAATAGHHKVVSTLLKHGAEIEAQSERTKDTPLSFACSGGRYDVVEVLLAAGANKEHRNVSDYTPLSLAASGGYVNIIKVLLTQGAEINSRTGSKLGISPLMLAAMNGHATAVKMLLDMGSDINAQIETNRNTALTLACFQGRHEVVGLLLDRKANVEHRAKTGLTPLMEAASGGYIEVGRVLLDKGADVNAAPVPSSRDTALTIAADKGHLKFVELLLMRGAAVEVKNKKGNSPLWLAANGGHMLVVKLLKNYSANIDSQDNRRVSCLMAAFRKGHNKVIEWMVNHVTQFPSEQEMMRYISTVSDNELNEKCKECARTIRAAKEAQDIKAYKNASSLLEELYLERTREESRKAAAARRRERKKKKKMEKKEKLQKKLDRTNKIEGQSEQKELRMRDVMYNKLYKEEGDSGIEINSQGSSSSENATQNSNDDKLKPLKKIKYIAEKQTRLKNKRTTKDTEDDASTKNKGESSGSKVVFDQIQQNNVVSKMPPQKTKDKPTLLIRNNGQIVIKRNSNVKSIKATQDDKTVVQNPKAENKKAVVADKEDVKNTKNVRKEMNKNVNQKSDDKNQNEFGIKFTGELIQFLRERGKKNKDKAPSSKNNEVTENIPKKHNKAIGLTSANGISSSKKENNNNNRNNTNEQSFSHESNSNHSKQNTTTQNNSHEKDDSTKRPGKCSIDSSNTSNIGQRYDKKGGGQHGNKINNNNKEVDDGNARSGGKSSNNRSFNIPSGINPVEASSSNSNGPNNTKQSSKRDSTGAKVTSKKILHINDVDSNSNNNITVNSSRSTTQNAVKAQNNQNRINFTQRTNNEKQITSADKQRPINNTEYNKREENALDISKNEKIQITGDTKNDRITQNENNQVANDQSNTNNTKKSDDNSKSSSGSKTNETNNEGSAKKRNADDQFNNASDIKDEKSQNMNNADNNENSDQLNNNAKQDDGHGICNDKVTESTNVDVKTTTTADNLENINEQQISAKQSSVGSLTDTYKKPDANNLIDVFGMPEGENASNNAENNREIDRELVTGDNNVDNNDQIMASVKELLSSPVDEDAFNDIATDDVDNEVGNIDENQLMHCTENITNNNDAKTSPDLNKDVSENNESSIEASSNNNSNSDDAIQSCKDVNDINKDDSDAKRSGNEISSNTNSSNNEEVNDGSTEGTQININTTSNDITNDDTESDQNSKNNIVTCLENNENSSLSNVETTSCLKSNEEVLEETTEIEKSIEEQNSKTDSRNEEGDKINNNQQADGNCQGSDTNQIPINNTLLSTEINKDTNNNTISSDINKIAPEKVEVHSDVVDMSSGNDAISAANSEKVKLGAKTKRKSSKNIKNDSESQNKEVSDSNSSAIADTPESNVDIHPDAISKVQESSPEITGKNVIQLVKMQVINSKNQETSNEFTCKSVNQSPQTTKDTIYKNVQVPVHAISRVIGRAGGNINAIRAVTGAYIEVEKQGGSQNDRSIAIKGTLESTELARLLIAVLIKNPDIDILRMLPNINGNPELISALISDTENTQCTSPTLPTTSSEPLKVVEVEAATSTPSVSQTLLNALTTTAAAHNSSVNKKIAASKNSSITSNKVLVSTPLSIAQRPKGISKPAFTTSSQARAANNLYTNKISGPDNNKKVNSNQTAVAPKNDLLVNVKHVIKNTSRTNNTKGDVKEEPTISILQSHNKNNKSNTSNTTSDKTNNNSSSNTNLNVNRKKEDKGDIPNSSIKSKVFNENAPPKLLADKGHPIQASNSGHSAQKMKEFPTKTMNTKPQEYNALNDQRTDQRMMHSYPKADLSKAPGYRGSRSNLNILPSPSSGNKFIPINQRVQRQDQDAPTFISPHISPSMQQQPQRQSPSSSPQQKPKSLTPTTNKMNQPLEHESTNIPRKILLKPPFGQNMSGNRKPSKPLPDNSPNRKRMQHTGIKTDEPSRHENSKQDSLNMQLSMSQVNIKKKKNNKMSRVLSH